MGLLENTNDFFRSFSTVTKKVSLPHSKDSVVIRGLTAAELIHASEREDNQLTRSSRENLGYMVDIIMACMIKPALADTERDNLIRTVPFTTIQYLFREIMAFSGMTDDAAEQTAKNFGSGQNGVMDTDSPMLLDESIPSSSGRN